MNWNGIKPRKPESQIIIIISVIFLLSSNSYSQVKFVDVTKESGIHFKHTDGRSGRRYIVETLGSGVAFFDYNNDGYLDIYFVNGASLPLEKSPIQATNALYRNNWDGTFTDVTKEAGVGDTGYGVGCAVGDYNNDGYPDLYITNYGTNVLYKNNGDGTFTDVTKAAGVGDTRWGASCAFADYDNDSDLDLFIANYLDFKIEYYEPCSIGSIMTYCDPRAYYPLRDTLYRNNGDGTFADVTKSVGINFVGRGLGVVWGDYDNDGDVDLYVANDTDKNVLYQNNGDGTFTDVSLLAGVGYNENGVPENGMGTNWGDYDNDGYFDLIVTNFSEQINTLYHNDGNGFFTDVSYISGIGEESFPFLSWSTHFFDYDNDGYRDIFVANGHLHDNVHQFSDVTTYAQKNHLFRNNRNGTFSDISEKSGQGMSLKKVSRGAALGDYDNDGDIDIVITNSNQPPDLLRNDGGNKNNWLMIKTVGTKSNRSGIGARIKILSQGKMQSDEVRSGSGYLSQNDLRVFFGLGKNAKVELVEIHWPSGIVQKIEDVKANQLLIVTEGE